MKKILFVLAMLVSTVCNAYKWEKETLVNPFTKEMFPNYVYDNGDITVKISDFIENTVYVEVPHAFGKFRYNLFTKKVTSRIMIKLYDVDGNKLWRGKVSVNLGKVDTNLHRQFGIIHCKDLYEHLKTNNGYIVITYCKFGTNDDFDIAVPCINN